MLKCKKPFRVFPTINGKKTKSIIESPKGDFLVGCGVCPQCKKQYVNNWLMRILHEKKYKKKGMFITLTYDDDSLVNEKRKLNGKEFYRRRVNKYGQAILEKKDLQDFIKKVRKKVEEVKNKLRINYGKISYLGCGEYGDKTGRPHYHMIILGLDYVNEMDVDIIKESWKHGMVDIGTAQEESIRYTLKYIDKKFNGEMLFSEYVSLDMTPVFKVSSKNIGLEWLVDNYERIIIDGGIYSKGKVLPVPRYYRKKLKEILTNEEYDKFLLNDLKNRKDRELAEIKDIIDYDFNNIWFDVKPMYVKGKIEEEQRRSAEQADLNIKSKNKLFSRGKI